MGILNQPTELGVYHLEEILSCASLIVEDVQYSWCCWTVVVLVLVLILVVLLVVGGGLLLPSGKLNKNYRKSHVFLENLL